MNAKLKNLTCLHILFIFYSFVAVAAKVASGYPLLSYEFIFYYGIELVMIAVYAYFWQIIIKRFPLGVAYSNKGIVIIWTLIWSAVFFHEKIKFCQIAGVLIILLGITLVAKNDK